MMSAEPFRQENISFNADGLKLKGVLHLPDIPAATGGYWLPWVIQQRQLAQTNCLGRTLQPLWYCLFSIRSPRLRHSEGEFGRVTSLEARCRDLMAAVAAVNSRIDTGAAWGCSAAVWAVPFAWAPPPDWPLT